MRTLLSIFTLAIFFLPLSALAQTNPYQYQRGGIFDCNQDGAYALPSSVGALSARGGVYVPVSDAAVTLNTGVLVYKECVLREVINRQREAAMAGFFKQMNTSIERGRNGEPQYVVNQNSELLVDVSDPTFLEFLEDGTLDALADPIQSQVTRSLAREYQKSTRQPQSVLACPYEDPKTVWESILSNGTSCNPIVAYANAREIASARDVAAREAQLREWEWGRGYYARTDNAQYPLQRRTVTPASVIQESFQQLLGSPVRQLESANDIGQMVGALYAGITTQVVSDSQGLAGISSRTGSQPSYLDQVVSQSGQGLRNAVIDLALKTLNGDERREAEFLAIMEAIGLELTRAIEKLRSAEKQCWNIVISKVCASGMAADKTCTDSDGVKYKVATSTVFSQRVIDSQIGALASTTVTDINTSQQALQRIRQLKARVGTGSSLDEQRAAIEELDRLTAQRLMHSQADLEAASVRQRSIGGAMDSLVDLAVENWTSAPDPAVGWCNVNNAAVVKAWKDNWEVKP